MSFSREGLGFQRRKKSTREIGDAPSIGQVARMHKNALSLRERLSYAGRVPLILLALGLFSFGAGITGLVLWVAGASGVKNPVVFNSAASPRSLPRIPIAAVPDARELEKTVSAMLAAKSPRDLEPLVRGSIQRPDGMLAKLAGLEASDGKITLVKYLGPVFSHCLQLESVVVTFDSGKNRLALLSPDPGGSWRVDFDAFDRHVSRDWDLLLSGAPIEGTVRIHACPDNYYQGIYQNDREWACYGFASPDHETLMFGYARRGSPQHLAMAQTLRPARRSAVLQPKRMTLDIRHAGTGNRRQFEITRVLADDWALGNEPLDALAAKANSSAGE